MKKGRVLRLLAVCMMVCALLLTILPTHAFAAGFRVTTPSLSLKLGQKGTLSVIADNAAGRVDWMSEGAVSASGSVWVENSTEEITVSATGVGDGRVTITLYDAATFDGEELSSTYSADFTVELARQMAYGMKGSDVLALQNRLNALGYDAGEPDGYFGTFTQNALMEFQETSGLYPDGIAGVRTMDALMTYDLVDEGGDVPQVRKLAYGMSGDDVYEIQVALAELGYPVGAPDGVFGPMTEDSVMQFQKKNGLNVDGIAELQTQSRIFADDAVPASGAAEPAAASGRALRNGMSGEDVYELQVKLMNAGYLGGGGADGVFGPITENAVKGFQRDHGLNEDGVAGSQTLDLLDSGSDAGSVDRALSYGTSGNDVLKLQKALADRGYYRGDQDGAFGAYTEAAVIAFQQDLGLGTDGIAGPITLGALGLW